MSVGKSVGEGAVSGGYRVERWGVGGVMMVLVMMGMGGFSLLF